jgi:dTDP-glucose pyrophosphorylase
VSLTEEANFSGISNIWRQTILTAESTIGDAIGNLDRYGLRIVLIVSSEGEFIGTVSDGDIRRGLLKGLDMNSPIANVVHHNALVVPREMSRETVVQLMMANKIHQVPIVDELQKLVGLHLWDEVTTVPVRSNLMVIMAGGKGTRLLPHTENAPKPMVEVAGKPMLEHIIERGKLEGFTHFVLAIYHLGHLIEDYFGNGEHLGVQIEYLREQSPLGTAGALSLLIPRPESSFVVTNGDVMTDIHYGELLDFHERYKASATMAVRVHEWQHPFGVVHTEGVKIVGYVEKPITRSHINSGVYVLSPAVLGELSVNAACDMPTLFERLQANGKRTIAYPMHEPWLDVGRPNDLINVNLQYMEEIKSKE